MGLTLLTRRVITAVGVSLLLGACTTHKQETPALTGPSGLGTSLVITVSPDVLTQDGASQSLVQIQAYDRNGQPLRNVSMRVEIAVDGSITDFGALSARNVVTDNNGRASVVYTAPPAPVFSNITDTVVQIMVTPSANDFANATARFVNIRLTPPGVVGPPRSPLQPEFVAPAATVGNAAVFQASVVDATGADATSQVTSYVWNFGDGTTATGRTVTHTFNNPGTMPVTLTITDSLNRTNTVSHSVIVGAGSLPQAKIETPSPSPYLVGQPINFNASGSSAEAGHRIVDFAWNFGDGTLGSGVLVQHTYTKAGVYTVTLKVTDDAGRKSTIQTVTVNVQ